jgi:UDPglucose 6-dehydrogenase
LGKKRISVVGTGYVGLSTAVGFAGKCYSVITSTHECEKASLVNRGIPPFHEPGLAESLQKAVRNGYLKCVVGREEAILNTDITFVAVGTPSQSDGSIELQFIESSAGEIGEALAKKNGYHLVVVKSTVVPGTTENVVKPALEKSSKKTCGVDFGLCMSPEFLRQGYALYDTLNPDRIVIGQYDQKSGDVLEALYREFYAEKTPPIIRTNISSAELIKYASNAFLATKISFANTIANMCEKIPGADVTLVTKAMGLDKRIGPLFLNAGLGYGGSCFPKDVKAVIAYSKGLGYEPELLENVEKVNKTQPLKAVEFCQKLLGSIKGKRIAILGLAFKPDTDDMREARVVPLVNQLLKEGAAVVAYDPVAIPKAKTILKDKIEYASSTLECLKNSDCCILVTEWDEFRKLTPEDFLQNMRQSILIDGRRIYDPKVFSQKLKFAAIGLGPNQP